MATKAELQAEIVRLNEQLLAQGKELEKLRLALHMEGGPAVHVDAQKRRWMRYVTKEGNLCYILPKPLGPVQMRLIPDHFRQAREAAMRMGHAVRVAA